MSNGPGADSGMESPVQVTINSMDIYLIDGSSYVYRAYYAIRGLRDSKGRPTNAIFGFTNMLLKIIRDLKPGGLAIIFDTPHRTERHVLYGEYKGHRPDTPDEMVQQIPSIRKVIAAMRIAFYEVPGYEADDVIGTIAEKAAGAGHNVFIVTADKDMLQLVDGRIKVYAPIKNIVHDSAYVVERFGVPPERVPEYMALTGDTVDNIPGVKGIGEKTAKELLTEFTNLDEIIGHPEKIKKEKTRKLVTEGIEDIKLSRELAKINRAVPMDMDISEFAVREPDWRALLAIFKEFEFTSLMKQVPGAAPEKMECRAVLDPVELKTLAGGIKGEFAISAYPFDSSLVRSEMAGFAMAPDARQGFYVPLRQDYMGAPAQMNPAEAINTIKPLLKDENIPKTGHNLKQAMILFNKAGAGLKGILHDTMIASHLLNPLRGEHGLETTALEHLGIKKPTLAELAGKGKAFKGVPVEDAANFACTEAGLSIELRDILFPKLKEEQLEDCYYQIEMPLIPVLARMEEAGMKVDTERLHAISGELERELDALRSRIYFLAGCEFNINSPRQLGQILFDRLGLTPGKKKKTGYSTEVGVLEELAKHHELPRELLEWRALFKLKSTYVDVLPGLVNAKTGRIHTSFNQAATATGRLSSTDPNLQNIPIRGAWGIKVRQAFVPEEGNVIVSADYSQIELRVLAHLSGDETLQKFFREGRDIHTATAAEILGIAPERVTPDHRRIAKGVNFGVVYGITPYGLSEQININTTEAKEYIDKYFERHPGVKEYIRRVIEEGRKKGFVRTISGRKRPIPELKSADARTRALGERLAMNSPVQGSAADIIKKAMINISQKLEGSGTKLILQVHDELVFECPKAEAPDVKKFIRREMENAVSLSVPVEVQAGAGRNWAEAH